MAVFTWERITFRKTFWIAIHDWDRDLNYVRSHVLQTPSQSSGSAHCEVIFCSHYAVRADWPMHGFIAHFQNAHAWITFRKSFAFTFPRIGLSARITIQNAFFFRVSNHVSKAWFETAFHSQGLKSGFQIRKGPNHVPKRLSEHDSFSCEQAQCLHEFHTCQLSLFDRDCPNFGPERSDYFSRHVLLLKQIFLK